MTVQTEIPIIRVKNAIKKYDSLVVIDQLSLNVQRGEQVVLIGPSGSGKSTLLRCLIGLERLNEGTIEVDGELLGKKYVNLELVDASTAELRRVRSKLSMVFQHFNLFPNMTVLRNVMIGPLHGKKVPKQEAEATALKFLEKVGLMDKVNAYPAQISGGQKQRVAIARALAMEPEIMLFDEVTSALDVELIAEVLEVMRDLANEGMTMIVVTHEIHFAQDVADRVLYFEKGKIIEECSPDVMFKCPQSPEAQRFLQSMLNR